MNTPSPDIRAPFRAAAKLAGRALALVASAVFPHFCVRCGREGGLVCAVCADSVFARRSGHVVGPSEVASVFGATEALTPLPEGSALAAAVSMAPYEDRAFSRLLHAWKYDRVLEAEHLLCRAFGDFVRDNRERLGALAGDGAIVVPVPMHRLKEAARGFNQAEALARTVASEVGAVFRDDVVERRFGGAAQADTDGRDARFANMQGMFRPVIRAQQPAFAGKPVFLVDDVYTTGATLESCAATLRAAGAGPVVAVTVLRRLLTAAPGTAAPAP